VLGGRRWNQVFVSGAVHKEVLGALGYYLGLTSHDRRSQILGIIAAVLNVISMVISGLSGPPQ
jgi:hypothetical protein